MLKAMGVEKCCVVLLWSITILLSSLTLLGLQLNSDARPKWGPNVYMAQSKEVLRVVAYLPRAINLFVTLSHCLRVFSCTQGGAFTVTHDDGGGSIDAIHITLCDPQGNDASKVYLPHNLVAMTPRYYTEEDLNLATGILSGNSCKNEKEKKECMEKGEKIRAELAHGQQQDKQNTLPTPEIVATMRKWGYVV